MLTLQDLKNEIDTLIDNGVDLNTPVHISYDYGDYWHTKVAPGVENIELTPIKYSDYHNMDMIDDKEDYDNNNQVIVIS